MLDEWLMDLEYRIFELEEQCRQRYSDYLEKLNQYNEAQARLIKALGSDDAQTLAPETSMKTFGG